MRSGPGQETEHPPAQRARAVVGALALGIAVVFAVPAGAAPDQVDCVVNPSAPQCQGQQPPTTTTEPGGVDPTTTTTDPAGTTTTTDPGDGTTTTTSEPAAVVPTTAAPTTAPPTTARPVPTTAAPVTTTTQPATTLTTQMDLLVPGDGTAGAESTTTTLRTESRVSTGSGPSDGTLIALIIGGLVVVAALVAVLTWRYWVSTRPSSPRRAPA